MQDSSSVSVLDLDSIMPAGRTRDARRTAGISMKLMCISLNDVIDVRLDGKADARLDGQIVWDGGAYRDRTDDLLNANQALSQLS